MQMKWLLQSQKVNCTKKVTQARRQPCATYTQEHTRSPSDTGGGGKLMIKGLFCHPAYQISKQAFLRSVYWLLFM